MMKKTKKIDKEKIRLHAGRNISSILDKLGIAYSQRGNLLQSTCPCNQHGGDGDNETAFSWRNDIQHWICWTHHCEEEFGGDIFALIRSVLDLNFQESVEWVAEFLDKENIDLSQDVAKPVQQKIGIVIHKPLDETRLKFLKPNPEFLLNRGYSAEVINKFQIGSWNRLGTFMHNRVIVPVRDHQGFLVGFSGRTIVDESEWEMQGIKEKWLHGRYFDRFPIKGEFNTSSVLFNLHNAKSFMGSDRRLFLVEGPLDGLKLEMAGIHNWIATLGLHFDYRHRILLVKYGINRISIAYDGDEAGDSACIKLKKSFGDLFNADRIELPKDKDPGDLSVDEIKKIFI
mgnify:CR=1 FL=1